MAMDLGDAKLTIKAKDEYSDAFAKVTNQLEGMKNSLRKVGIAMTAMGAAGLKLVADARQLNAQLGVTAIGLGVTASELRNLALSTANVTFPVKEVTDTFDLLTRAGVRDIEVLKATATAFDTLGDAIGVPASLVTEHLIPAMKTFNVTAIEMAGKTDSLTYLFRNTTVSLDDFNRMVGYVTPDLVEMGLTTEDMIAILAELEEQGYSGEVMTREFRKAVTLATQEQIPLNEALGISTEKIDSYKKELEGATGITQQYAAVANEQYGIVDKLKHAFSELMLKLGTVLKPLEPVLAAMTALGPAMILLSSQIGISTLLWVKHTVAVVASKVAMIAHAIATRGATIAMWLLNAAMSANPFLLLASAIAVAVGALLIFRNKVDSATKEAIEDFQALATDARIAFESIALAGKTMTESLMTDVVANISRMFDEVINMINTRKEETISAMYAVFAGMYTTTEEELAKMTAQLTEIFDVWAGEYSAYGEEIREILRTAREENRKLTEEENARINELMLFAAQEGIKITSVGTQQMEDLWRKLGESTESITREMYVSMRWASEEATKQIVADANKTFVAYETLIEELIKLGRMSKEQGDAMVTDAEMEKNARIRAAEAETKALIEELNKRYSAFKTFWEGLKHLFGGGAKLTIERWELPKPTGMAKMEGMQFGGIVTRPTMALVGEQGPEAIIPLPQGAAALHRESSITLHIGNFMGDELSLRQFTRKLQEVMREEDRRTSFPGVNTGYFHGRSSI